MSGLRLAFKKVLNRVLNQAKMTVVETFYLLPPPKKKNWEVNIAHLRLQKMVFICKRGKYPLSLCETPRKAFFQRSCYSFLFSAQFSKSFMNEILKRT